MYIMGQKLCSFGSYILSATFSMMFTEIYIGCYILNMSMEVEYLMEPYSLHLISEEFYNIPHLLQRKHFIKKWEQNLSVGVE